MKISGRLKTLLVTNASKNSVILLIIPMKTSTFWNYTSFAFFSREYFILRALTSALKIYHFVLGGMSLLHKNRVKFRNCFSCLYFCHISLARFIQWSNKVFREMNTYLLKNLRKRNTCTPYIFMLLIICEFTHDKIMQK